MKAISISCISLLTVSIAMNAAQGGVEYAVTDLGIPSGGISSVACGINNSGEISGMFQDSSFTSYAVFWKNAAASAAELPALSAASTQAGAINDSGVISGSYTNSSSTYGCVWTDPTHTPSAFVAPVGSSGYIGAGINNAGQLTGYFYESASATYHACFWSGISSVPVKLTEPVGALKTYAIGINTAGQIIGSFEDAIAYQACSWSSYSAAPTTLAILVGTQSSQASGINSSGQVVGSFSTTYNNLHGEHACIWNGDSVTDLNTLISPASGWTLTEANGINDSGLIVGQGMSNGVAHAILLSPLQPLPPAPTLKVAGKKKLKTNRSKVAIHGTASGAVTSISYQIGKRTRTARGTTSWKFTAQLNPGRNQILISSHGPGGSSSTAKVTVTRL